MSLVDDIALVVAGVRQVQAAVSEKNSEEAVKLQSDVIDPLEELALEIDVANLDTIEGEAVEGKVRFPRRIRKKGGLIKWTCCKDASKTRTRKGVSVWSSWCKWKKGSKTGGMSRIVGSGRKPRPKKITLGGRVMKRC